MAEVLLAGCTARPLEPAGELLITEFAHRGVTAQWAIWDDPTVDWSTAKIVAVRSTWDYDARRDEFLAWSKTVATQAKLLNGPETFAWNTDKSYLLDLEAADVPVVPSQIVTDPADFAAALGTFPGPCVIKPCVAAGGRGLIVVEDATAIDNTAIRTGPWLVQPVLDSVRTEGEISVFILGGEITAQVQKVAAGNEIRVHELYGGRSVQVDITNEAAELATTAFTAAEKDSQHRAALRARRPDAPEQRHPGGQRAGAHRTRAVPGHRAGQRRRVLRRRTPIAALQ